MPHNRRSGALLPADGLPPERGTHGELLLIAGHWEDHILHHARAPLVGPRRVSRRLTSSETLQKLRVPPRNPGTEAPVAQP